jgi:hypothetical protein
MNSQSQSECNSTMQEQTNRRIYDRNIPSQMLQPYLDVRPVMTKYSYFPIVDPKYPIKYFELEQSQINNERRYEQTMDVNMKD